MPGPTHREQVIAGLRELAQFLEDHPDVPVPPYTAATMMVHVRHENGADFADDDDAAAMKRVHQIANMIGARVDSRGNPSATRQFPGGVEYEVVHVPAQERAEWAALQSYRDNFQAAS